jgi:hypothetical protein
MLQQTAKKCPAFSSVWLIGINFLYFLVGILLIGLSSWGITQAKEDPVTAALPAGSLVTLLVTGVFLMLVAVLGWLGVAFNYKNCGRVSLGFYATILIILMIMEFSAAGAVITFTGKLDDFGPAQQVKDAGIYFLINQSYADCCCTFQRCPNDTCWLPSNLLYPCDSITTFRLFLEQYLSDRLIPICVIAILIGLVQFFTAIVACCNQCRGRTTEEQKKIAGGPLSYDGMYGDAAPEDGSFGYETYIKGSATRPGSAAAAAQTSGAAAPKAPASGGGRAHSKK